MCLRPGAPAFRGPGVLCALPSRDTPDPALLGSEGSRGPAAGAEGVGTSGPWALGRTIVRRAVIQPSQSPDSLYCRAPLAPTHLEPAGPRGHSPALGLFPTFLFHSLLLFPPEQAELDDEGMSDPRPYKTWVPCRPVLAQCSERLFFKNLLCLNSPLRGLLKPKELCEFCPVQDLLLLWKPV